MGSSFLSMSKLLFQVMWLKGVFEMGVGWVEKERNYWLGLWVGIGGNYIWTRLDFEMNRKRYFLGKRVLAEFVG